MPRLSASCATMLAPLGAVPGLKPPQRSSEGDDTVYSYRVRFADVQSLMPVKLGPSGQLTGLFIRRAE